MKSKTILIKKVTLEKLEKYLNKVGYEITNTNWRMIRKENKGRLTVFHITDTELAIDSKDLFGGNYSGGLKISFDNIWLEYTYGDNNLWDMVSLLLIPGDGNKKNIKSFVSFYKNDRDLI